MVVVPFGVAYGQDYDAVAKRLGRAVEEGELTQAQADAMMAGLKKQMKSGEKDELHAYFEQVWAKLQAAVAAGKMSAEDAEAKMAAIKKAKPGAGKKEAHHKAIGERLKAAVKAGKLTEEEAWAKWKAITKGGQAEADEDGSIEERLAAIGERLRAAVKAGKLTEEEAWAKWFEIKEKRIAPHLKSAVKAGKMTEEKAWAIWRGIEKAEAGARLKAAVKKGKMSEEEARAKWAEINQEAEDEDEEEDEDDEDEGEEEDEDDEDEDDEDEHGDGDDDEGIKPVPAEAAHGIGKALLEAAPVNFAGDPANAVGVVSVDDGKVLGMILVPAKGMNEEEAEMEVGDSEPLALLFCSPSILPVTPGTASTLVERGKLHSVTITDGEGKKHDSNCMMLIVKRIAEEDYRLYGIGKRPNEPLFDARFTDGEGPGETPLAVEVKDIDEESKTAAAVITVFDKYQAAFRAGVAE